MSEQWDNKSLSCVLCPRAGDTPSRVHHPHTTALVRNSVSPTVPSIDMHVPMFV